jgi:hypothetical protein
VAASREASVDFTLSDEHRMIRDLARQVARETM